MLPCHFSLWGCLLCCLPVLFLPLCALGASLPSPVAVSALPSCFLAAVLLVVVLRWALRFGCSAWGWRLLCSRACWLRPSCSCSVRSRRRPLVRGAWCSLRFGCRARSPVGSVLRVGAPAFGRCLPSGAASRRVWFCFGGAKAPPKQTSNIFRAAAPDRALLQQNHIKK